MTVNQLISDIRNIASSGSNPIEFKIEDSQILFWCNEVRSMLISQAIQKKQDISDIWIQWINCLELEQVDKSECCEIQTNCYILRSVQTLPNTIETNGDNSIIRVITPTGKIISKSTSFESQWSYGKYTKEQPRWFIKNSYLYIINEEFLKYVDVALLAENPSDLSAFNTCSGTSCFNLNSDYPCSLKMASMITDIVLKTKVYPFLQLPADNTNDAANTTPSPNTRNI
jgi:hypothetical protein